MITETVNTETKIVDGTVVTTVTRVKVSVRPMAVRDLLEREIKVLRTLRTHREKIQQDLAILSEEQFKIRDEAAREKLRSTDEHTRSSGSTWLYDRESFRMCLDKGLIRYYEDVLRDLTGVRQRRVGLTDLGASLADKLPKPRY